MADPFSVNCWAAIWVDMIHECTGAYGMGKGMFAPQNSLITIHEQDDMHFFYHLQCSLFRCCLQCFNYLHYLSDDGDVSFDDDFDKIGNSVSSSCDFLFYLSLMMLFKVGPSIPVSMPALQNASLGQEEWAC